LTAPSCGEFWAKGPGRDMWAYCTCVCVHA
jgi:hypothetical protein